MFEQREKTSTPTSGPSNVVDTTNDLARTNAPSADRGGVRSKVNALVVASILMVGGERAEAAQTMGATNAQPTPNNTDQSKAPAAAPSGTVTNMTTPVTPLGLTRDMSPVLAAQIIAANAVPNSVASTVTNLAATQVLNQTNIATNIAAAIANAAGSTNVLSGGTAIVSALSNSVTNLPNAPQVVPQPVDLSKINVTGQVYDNFGIRKDIKHAGAGLFTQSPAGVLHVVALGIEKAGRNNIPDGVMAKVTVETHAGSVDYLIDPRQVPASDKITPTVFREATQADSGLNSLWQSITKGRDDLQVRIRVTRVNPENVTFTYVMGREFTEQASLKMTFVKP